MNPVPLARTDKRRPHAHHNPLEPYRGEGWLRYNPRPKRTYAAGTASDTIRLARTAEVLVWT